MSPKPLTFCILRRSWTPDCACKSCVEYLRLLRQVAKENVLKFISLNAKNGSTTCIQVPVQHSLDFSVSSVPKDISEHTTIKDQVH